MKKLLFFIGILSLSLATFGQYTEDKLPSGLTVAASLGASDVQIIQKSGESYVKGIKAYHAYLYYKKMLDSIVNLSISGNFQSKNVIATAAVFSANIVGTNVYSTDTAIFGDEIYIYDTLHFYNKTYLPEWGYAMVLDTTDHIVKLAPMPEDINDFNNVAYVNCDLAADIESQLIFDSYASAANWITNNGSPSASNQWTVLSAGNLDEDVKLVKFINLRGYDAGSYVKSVASTVAFTGTNTFDITVKNMTIGNVYVYADKLLNINDCVIENVTPVEGAGNGYIYMNNCFISGGDFSNTRALSMINNQFIATEHDIENLSLVSGTEFDRCQFISTPSYLTYSIIDLPNDIRLSHAHIEQSFSVSDAISWRNSVINCKSAATFESDADITNCHIDIDTISVTSGHLRLYNSDVVGKKIGSNNAAADITNCHISIGTISVTSGNLRLYNSDVLSNKLVSDNATIELHQSLLAHGDIELNDTATLKIYEGSEIDGDIIQVDPTTAIKDYRSTFGEIYYCDGSSTVTIPTGASYVKITAFYDEVEGRNCTTSTADDKITITESGFYEITAEFTTICGTDSVVLETAVHIDGDPAKTLKMKRKYQLMNDVGHGHISGKVYIDCSDGDVDIDVRARHDNGGSVDFTAVNGKLGVHKIGEY